MVIDYTSLPEKLIYRRRNTLKEFTEGNELNALIIDNLEDVDAVVENGFDGIALTCMNTAYYICTEVVRDAKPFRRWTVYRDQAKVYDGPLCQEFQNITLTIVTVLLKHYDKEWQQQNEKFLNKIEDFVTCNFSTKLVFDSHSSFADTYQKVHQGLFIDPIVKRTDTVPLLPSDAFAVRDITDEEISVTDIAKRIDYAVEAIRNIPSKGEQVAFINHTIAGMRRTIKEEMSRDPAPMFPGTLDIEKAVKELKLLLSEITDGPTKVPQPGEAMPMPDKQAEEIKKLKRQLAQAKAKVEEQQKEIDDIKSKNAELEEQIDFFQQKKSAMNKRKDQRGGVAVGLTKEQAKVMAEFLAHEMDLDFSGRKGGKGTGIGLIVHYLWGYAPEKVRQATAGNEDKKYVASIFGPFNPEMATRICKKWTQEMLPPWKCEE